MSLILKDLCVTQKKLNLTRTVRKLPIDENLERAGHYIHDDRQVEIKYDDQPEVGAYLRFAFSSTMSLLES